jgi:hypothetical protein
MKISRFIMIVGCLVAFLTVPVVKQAFCEILAKSASAAVVQKTNTEKGFFEKLADGIAGIANGIAKTISKAINFLSGNRIDKDTANVGLKGSIEKDQMILKSEIEEADGRPETIQLFQADKSVIQVDVQTKQEVTQDKPVAKVESASVQQPTILQQPVVVVEQEPVRIVPEKVDTFANVTGFAEIQQQQIDEDVDIQVKSEADLRPEEKPAEVLIPKSEAVVNITQVKDEIKNEAADKRVAETVPVISGSMIIAGNLPNIPSSQTQTRQDTGTSTRTTTGTTTRTQSPIVQSGEALGTGAATESQLELMGRQSAVQRGSATVQSGEILGTGAVTESPLELVGRETAFRSEGEKCGETRVLFSDGIKNAVLTTDKRYVLADTGEGRKSVVSICSGIRLDCPAERSVTVDKRVVETETTRTVATTEANVGLETDDCKSKLTITQGELSEEARTEMLDVCQKSKELLSAAVEIVVDAPVIKVASIIAGSSLVYITNDMVRTMKIDSSDPSKPILDANVLVADNVMQFKPLVFCRSGEAVSDCSGKYDELKATVSNIASNVVDSSSVSCDSKVLENVTLLARSKGVEFSDVLKIEKDASTEPVESVSSDEAAPDSAEAVAAGDETAQDVAGLTAESAEQDLLSPDVYKSLPPGGEAQEVPLQTSKPFGSSEVLGGGGCSLVAETDMNIVPIWAWVIFSIGFACVAVRMLLKNKAKEVSWHEQKDWNSYRRRRLPRS